MVYPGMKSAGRPSVPGTTAAGAAASGATAAPGAIAAGSVGTRLGLPGAAATPAAVACCCAPAAFAVAVSDELPSDTVVTAPCERSDCAKAGAQVPDAETGLPSSAAESWASDIIEPSASCATSLVFGAEPLFGASPSAAALTTAGETEPASAGTAPTLACIGLTATADSGGMGLATLPVRTSVLECAASAAPDFPESMTRRTARLSTRRSARRTEVLKRSGVKSRFGR